MEKRNAREESGLTELLEAGWDSAPGTYENLGTKLKTPKHKVDRKREFSVYGTKTDTERLCSSCEFARSTRDKSADMFTQAAVATVPESPRTMAGAEVKAGLRCLIRESVSENTVKTYGSALRQLGTFMETRVRQAANINLLLEKLDDATLARYVAALEAEGKAPATAQIAVAAVSYAAKLRERKSPAGRLTEAAMRGLRRRGANRGRGQARGVTWTQAETVAVTATRDTNSLSGIRDAALISVMSDAMLRISEAAALLVSDVTGESDGSGRIRIRRSKTDQEGRGAVLYLGRPTMARVWAWQKAGGVNDGALFRRVSRGSLRTSRVGKNALSPLSIRRILKNRAEQAGIEGVSGHSLRIGAAQSMAIGGATLVDMQVAGRWQSPQMPARYASRQLAGRGAVARIRYGSE